MLKFFILLLSLLISACGEPGMPSPYHSIDVTWQHAQADFKLVDMNGKTRSLSDFSGKVVVLFFGYTHCPDVCPATLAGMAHVMRLLGKDASRVQVIFVTLDPERDSPELLSKYVPSFDPSFLALYGDARATAQAAKAFGVNYMRQDDKRGGYTLDHNDGLYLLGLRGKPLLISPNGQPAELLVQDIRLLLALGR